MIGATKKPAWETTSHTWLRSRYCRNRTLVAREIPVTMNQSNTMYHANNANALRPGGCPLIARKATIATMNTRSVITAFELETTTAIHDGNLALVRRNVFAWSDINPTFV